MPQLNFGNQTRVKRPGGWIIPVVLLILTVLIITLSVRVGNAGVFAGVRHGVHAVSSPLQSVCSIVGKPFRSSGSSSGSSYSDDEIEAIIQENEQLRTLVAQLEEYRQQNQRLTTLMTLSDIYGLETVSGKVIGTTDGWSRTATISVGSSDGVKVGMGVMSSCGLYGQVISVTSHTAKVQLITDASSTVSAMIQSTREVGIVSGSYDGNLTLDYIPVESTVGAGDIIMTSGNGGAYPRGIIIGTVKSVDPDSSRLYYRITVEPIFSIKSCEEVLVLTGNESETAGLVDMDLIQQVINSLGGSWTDWDAENREDEDATEPEEGQEGEEGVQDPGVSGE